MKVANFKRDRSGRRINKFRGDGGQRGSVQGVWTDSLALKGDVTVRERN